jgi:Fe2+ or Zn2+ uptake regulation protein
MSAPRLRSTRQRTAVARLLDDTEGFRSAQEIHGVPHPADLGRGR